MNSESRLLVHDGAFAVLGEGGDVTGRDGVTPDGLFLHDGRHLSRWRLTLDDADPDVLVPLRADGSGGTAVLSPPFRRDRPPACTVYREQAVVAGTLLDRLRFTANIGRPVTVRVAVTAAADFADVFALRGDRTFDRAGAEHRAEPSPDGVEFGYRRGEWQARTTVTAAPAPDAVTPAEKGGHRLEWTVTLPPHGSADLDLRVTAHPHTALAARGLPGEDRGPGNAPAAAEGIALSQAADRGEQRSAHRTPADRDGGPGAGGGDAPADLAARPAAEVDAYVSADPDPRELTDWPELRRACEQGLADLAALRVPAEGPDGEPLRVPAAGVPWFLTLFGRDSLLTSLFALPYRPDLAAATLPALAATQAAAVEAERVAEPGKIVHEIRHGELAHFGQVPFGRYYGTVDATPLFLVLLGEFTEQTGDTGTARRLERHARAAVDWMFRYGGLDERGYLVYRADSAGLANQNWKDSPGAICDADGTQAEGALAVSEVQGYAYDALRRTAGLARALWDDPDYADRLDAAADDLKSRFRRDFWMPEADFPALALDGDGRPATALTSDAGHLLWSGILDDRDATAVGRRLLRPDFFSGWGVRTLAAGQDAYHPLTYHRGSVWPHDNAVIALGLARHGLHTEVRRLAEDVLAAAERTGWRLPEVLAGHGRDEHPEPVSYPHSCSPQAWAAATPLALLTAVGAAPAT